MFITTSFIFLLAGILVVASAAIFGIRYLKPRAAREYDIIFAVMGVIYALCLLLEGWRLIPLLQFAQVLLVAMCAFFAVETFRLRLQLVEKTRGSSSFPRSSNGGLTRTYAGKSSVSGRGARTSIRRASSSEEEEERVRPRVAAPPKQLPRDTRDPGPRPRRIIRPGENLEDEDQSPPRSGPEDRRPPSAPQSERPSRRPPPRLPEEEPDEDDVLDVTSEVTEEEPPRRRTRQIVVEEMVDDEDEIT
ncbi:MAG: Ycf66 family protein [Thermostichales cyanobacterium SZTDM-1c_bins_54]